MPGAQPPGPEGCDPSITGGRVAHHCRLWDDRCGRAEARRQRLPIIGTAAVLVLAKERNLIPTCGPLLLAMRDEGYFLSDGLVAAVINQAGES
jgi:predicted nucleic acid-binding protein